ncbi:hypothetical protein GCM10011578_030440 [Streptomyces fuscichromogenes]|uniref:Uncharacterized protein n=1 Tax=Streptomyces fuscichromogenes TaxID=1324013 RepID=A0A918CRD5_9ACTN|nr:hypothetical protein GCM10011578_030440 [Streptomyces fuscichromogenes]
MRPRLDPPTPCPRCGAATDRVLTVFDPTTTDEQELFRIAHSRTESVSTHLTCLDCRHEWGWEEGTSAPKC